MGQTITEKILSRVLQRDVASGEVIYPEPDLITVHDFYIGQCDKDLSEFKVNKLYAPQKVIVATDHDPMAVSSAAAERQKRAREIVKKYDITMFFDAGRGGHGHIFPMEMGLIRPGMLVLGYDTHTANFGAVGTLGIAVVSEISEVLACGSVWLRVPETVRINLSGRLSPGVSVRDISQRLIGEIDEDVLDYSVVEYGGSAFEEIGFEGRMTLCNAPLESTAKSALVETDDLILDWVRKRNSCTIQPVVSDRDAKFKLVIEFDVSDLVPQVAVAPRANQVVDITHHLGQRVDHAFVGSCANGGLADLRDAASVLAGKKIAPGVRFVVTPGTQEVAAAAQAEGLVQIFLDAGAMWTPPGCGVCAGGMIAPLAAGEVSINTGTVNEPGRLGSLDAEIYLASPFSVAAAAVAGKIIDPRDLLPKHRTQS